MAHTSHKVVRDTWNIDWNIVGQVDPGYADKYLIDRLNVEKVHTDRSESREILDQATYRAARPQRTLELGAHMPHGGIIQSDEELEIIQQLQDKSSVVSAPENVAGENNNDNHVFQAADDGLEPYDWNMLDSAVSEHSSTRKAIFSDWDLKEEYKSNTNLHAVDVNVPLLPIPKRFLDKGSTMYFGEHLKYAIHYIDVAETSNVVGLCKMRLIITPEAIRFVTCTYYFDRVGQFTSDRKGDLNFVTFSEKTKGLYWTHYTKPKHDKSKKRFKKEVHRLGMRVEGIKNVFSGMPYNMFVTFANELTRRAKRDLGDDIYFPGSDGFIPPNKPLQERTGAHKTWMCYIVTSIMWQYKAQRPLKWTENMVLLDNLSHLLSTGVQGQMAAVVIPTHASMEEAEPKLMRTPRKRILRDIHKAVRKSTSPRDIIRAIFGCFYVDIQYKILSTFENFSLGNVAVSLIALEAAIRTGNAPKSAHHFLSKVMNNINKDIFKHFRNLIQGFQAWSNTNNYPNKHIFNKWIRFNSRMFDKGQNPMDWHHFEDTMNMAANFGVRIRLNKHASPRSLMRIHDKLSGYIRRDGLMQRSYPVFLPFTHPDKQYGKFTFVHLDTADKLVDEGTMMHHCVGSYADKCFNGTSLIFAMRNGRSWVTIELDATEKNYSIRQKYTIGDFSVENTKVNGIIDEWHRDLVNIHQHDQGTYKNMAGAFSKVMDAHKRIKDWSHTEGDDLIDPKSVIAKSQMDLESAIEELKSFGLEPDEVMEHVTVIEQKA